MYLKSFNEQGQANISISVDELNCLSNALCDYYLKEDHPFDNENLLKIRKSLYTFYEIINAGGFIFDDDFHRIIEHMGKERQEDEALDR